MKTTFYKIEQSHNYERSADLEKEMIIYGRNYLVQYFNDYDEILISETNEFFGDDQSYIDTNKFDSFCDTHDEHLEYYEDRWDGRTESVYQDYYKQDWDEWLTNSGDEYLCEFILDQIEKHKPKRIKRALTDRIIRQCTIINYHLKNILK